MAVKIFQSGQKWWMSLSKKQYKPLNSAKESSNFCLLNPLRLRVLCFGCLQCSAPHYYTVYTATIETLLTIISITN